MEMDRIARTIAGLALVLVVAAPALTATAGPKGKGGPKPKPDPLAPVVITAPFDDPRTTGSCSPAETCSWESHAETSGYLDAAVSTEPGATATRSGLASASLRGSYRLPQPVSALDISAEMTISAYAEALSPLSTSAVKVFASGIHGGCDACTTTVEVTVVEGRLTSSSCDPDLFCTPERSVQATMHMTNPGADVPAGTIVIRPFLRATTRAFVAGAHSGAVAQLQRIVFSPVR